MQTEGVLSQFPVSGEVLASPTRYRQGGMASRGVVSASRVYRYESQLALEAVVRFYNGRGSAEQWIKEGKNAVKWTKLSCRTFKDNQTHLQLFALAYNLANFLRRLRYPRIFGSGR